jgi:hypothetical protein
MAKRNGGIIGKVNTPTTSTATGVWRLQDQYNARKNDIWPGQPQPYSVDFLVIAGGGGGGNNGSGDGGGGGGAGGFRTSTQTVSPGTVITITVGDGGTYRNVFGDTGKGVDSSFSGARFNNNNFCWWWWRRSCKYTRRIWWIWWRWRRLFKDQVLVKPEALVTLQAQCQVKETLAEMEQKQHPLKEQEEVVVELVEQVEQHQMVQQVVMVELVQRIQLQDLQ